MRKIHLSLIPCLLLPWGCAQQKPPAPSPVIPVEWQDLSVGTPVTAENDFRIVVQGRTRGVFPGPLAVARVAAEVDPATGKRSLMLDTRPKVDFLAWNSVFDDLRSISEVFPLGELAMNGADPGASSVLDAAETLNARLLLLYAEIPQSDREYELRGVLYDVPAERPLAAIHADAYVSHPIPADAKASPDEPAESREQRDPRLAGLRAFETHARQCLMALMENDDPASSPPPEGWIPDRSIEGLLLTPIRNALPPAAGKPQ